MAQLVIDLTPDQSTRTMKVYGDLLRLGRDATPDEVAGALKTVLKDTVLSSESNKAIDSAASSVAPW